MYFINTLAILLFLFTTTYGYGQNEPPYTANRSAIQAYLENQSQASSPFESMARIQVEVQYSEFLDSLGYIDGRRSEVEHALIEVIAERAEMSSQLASGQITPEQLRAISNYEYLRSRMKIILNATELQLLDNRQGGMAEEQLRKTYLEQLNRISPEVTRSNQAIVIDILIEHMLLRETGPATNNRVTAEELVQQQLMSLMQARVELQNILEGKQLEMVNLYLNELRSNLFLNQSMSDDSSQ